MKNFLIIRVDDSLAVEVEEYFETLQEAEKYLQELQEDYEDWVIGYDDNYFRIENDYGNIEEFQILELDKKICEDKGE